MKRSKNLGFSVHYFFVRISLIFILLIIFTSSIFAVVHLGPVNPAEETAAIPEQQKDLEDKKDEFGLTDSMTTQYRTFLRDMFTADFGDSWTGRQESIEEDETDIAVNILIARSAKQTTYLWFLTVSIVGFGYSMVALLGKVVQYRPRGLQIGWRSVTVVPTFLLGVIIYQGLTASELFFGFNWTSMIVLTETVESPQIYRGFSSKDEIIRSLKLGLPPALVLGLPILAMISFIMKINIKILQKLPHLKGARMRGLSSNKIFRKHALPYITVPFIRSIREFVAILMGGTMIVEHIFGIKGLSLLFITAAGRGDYTTLQALFFLTFVFMACGILIQDILIASFVGMRSQEDGLPGDYPLRDPDYDRLSPDSTQKMLVPLRNRAPGFKEFENTRYDFRILWTGGLMIILLFQLGTIVDIYQSIFPGFLSNHEPVNLIGREMISNEGYQNPDGSWSRTFLGLSPAVAWTLRVVITYVYAIALTSWLLFGYAFYRRTKASPPMNISYNRVLNNRSAIFLGIILYILLVSLIFAPTLAPGSPEHARAPGSLTEDTQFAGGEIILYFDEEAGESTTTTVSVANSRSASIGTDNYGLLSYDKFGRFHPLGTTTLGTDLLTELLFGLRAYVFAGFIAMLISIKLTILTGISSIIISESKYSYFRLLPSNPSLFPVFPSILLFSIIFDGEITSSYGQLFFIGTLSGIMLWPLAWRIINHHWDSLNRAQFSGFRRIHVVIRIVKYQLRPVFSVGIKVMVGTIIITATLSYIGWDRIDTMPYDWARLVASGEQYLPTSSWHVSGIPMLALILLISSLYAASDLLDKKIGRVDRGKSPLEELLKRGGG